MVKGFNQIIADSELVESGLRHAAPGNVIKVAILVKLVTPGQKNHRLQFIGLLQWLYRITIPI